MINCDVISYLVVKTKMLSLYALSGYLGPAINTRLVLGRYWFTPRLISGAVIMGSELEKI